MAADCPRCRRELNPFVAHLCGVPEPWSGLLSNTSTSSPSSPASCCSSDGSCSCSRPAPTTGEIAPSTATLPEDQTPASGYSADKSSHWVPGRSLKVHGDQRGNVRETYRASWFQQVPPIKQLVRSESKPYVLRGMHLHRKQWDIWHFVEGDAIVRLRFGDGHESYWRPGQSQVIAIPPGVAHGFYTETGCILLYALTEEYDGSDEFGFYPFDGLTDESHPGWPRDHIGIVVSERDLRAPRLSEFEW